MNSGHPSLGASEPGAGPPPFLARLRRRPETEGPNLVAVDATDRLLLDELRATSGSHCADDVVTLGDRFGALTLGAATLTSPGTIRSHQDTVTSERALAANNDDLGLGIRFRSLRLGPELLENARLILMQLPKSLAELSEMADAVARYAHPEVTLLAGGRVKYLTPAMTEILLESFESVTAGLARQKSRVLTASTPRRVGNPPFPKRVELAEIDLTVVSHGGVFSHDRLDIGTRFLLEQGPLIAEDIATISSGPDTTAGAGSPVLLDLGCGTGILAALLARQHPRARVLAADRSAAAVASAKLTAQANGLGIEPIRDDALDSLPAASVDLIVCNPPFHLDQSVHERSADRLFHGAARALRPGGVMWTVYNSHLRHHLALARTLGPTSRITQNSKFTIARSERTVRF